MGQLGDTGAANPGGHPRAVIFGCSGMAVTAEEKSFFAEADPAGFILFERNCRDRSQIRGLVADLKESVGGVRAGVLIDQEGGRVQRLKPPRWRAAPPAAAFGAIDRHDRELAQEAARLNARLIATELRDLGITVNCAPVLDVPGPDGHEIIGDRAFGGDAGTVAALGLAACEGFLTGGVLPVIKHIPGHGRAAADSHLEMPVVDAEAGDLEATDLAPFRALSHMPWAMTAHVVYGALDGENPATTSAKVIKETIREAIGFAGVLVSDDIGMKALRGPYDRRAAAALAAGCDLVLHCSGDRAEMEAVAEGTGPLTAQAAARLDRGEAMRGEAAAWDADAGRARLDEILSQGTA